MNTPTAFSDPTLTTPLLIACLISQAAIIFICVKDWLFPSSRPQTGPAKELRPLQAEAETLKTNLRAKELELAAQEREVQKLTSELAAAQNQKIQSQANNEKSMTELKRLESDIRGIEESLDQEKKAFHEMKQRIQENKMRLELLNNKTKEAVESIAQFAQGKEFDEFRKSIHLDEITQKYEDQIKALKLENLEKKSKG